MDIVEQYVKLNDAIAQLEHQATALRQDLMRAGSKVCGNRYEVVVRHTADRVFNPELLPPEIRDDPQFWNVALREEVDVHPIVASPAFLRPQPQKQVDLLRYRC